MQPSTGGPIFMERGTWNGKKFEDEGDCDTFQCKNLLCQAEVAIVAHPLPRHKEAAIA